MLGNVYVVLGLCMDGTVFQEILYTEMPNHGTHSKRTPDDYWVDRKFPCHSVR